MFEKSELNLKSNIQTLNTDSEKSTNRLQLSSKDCRVMNIKNDQKITDLLTGKKCKLERPCEIISFLSESQIATVVEDGIHSTLSLFDFENNKEQSQVFFLNTKISFLYFLERNSRIPNNATTTTTTTKDRSLICYTDQSKLYEFKITKENKLEKVRTVMIRDCVYDFFPLDDSKHFCLTHVNSIKIVSFINDEMIIKREIKTRLKLEGSQHFEKMLVAIGNDSNLCVYNLDTGKLIFRKDFKFDLEIVGFYISDFNANVPTKSFKKQCSIIDNQSKFSVMKELANNSRLIYFKENEESLKIFNLKTRQIIHTIKFGLSFKATHLAEYHVVGIINFALIFEVTYKTFVYLSDNTTELTLKPSSFHADLGANDMKLAFDFGRIVVSTDLSDMFFDYKL